FIGCLLTCTAMSVGGCAVGPDYQRPGSLSDVLGISSDRAEAYVSGKPNAIAGPLATMSHWWDRLGDPALGPLVEEMLAKNYTLAAASARVMQSQAQLESAFGSRLPNVSVSPSGTRAFTTDTSGNRSYANSFSASGSVSWQVDLFGKLARSQGAAAARLNASISAQEGLVQSMIAQLVRSRVSIAILNERLKVAQTIAQSRKLTMESVERRYRSGANGAAATDVHNARQNYASAMADLPDLKSNLMVATHALDVLLARVPGTTSNQLDRFPLVPPPLDVPTHVPADLLERRPDIREAEFALIEATENVGVSIADMLPNLTLTGNLASDAADLSDLFSIESLAGSIVAQITQTLFDGGVKWSAVDVSRAQVDEMAANYAQAILEGIQDVEDALVTETYAAQRVALLRTSVEAVRLSEKISNSRYINGLGTFQSLLDTQRQRQQSEQTLLLEQQDQWNARIDLMLALGGDWYQASAETKDQDEKTNVATNSAKTQEGNQ
ncbi:MAG: efflux transporter outer membrane subunit, partial [Parvibaculaceae bacterium]|nr:efflux transporter outer membrane subunit [Parvibaculaceae bacterium]